MEAITFEFKSHITLGSNLPVKDLVEGVLYHVRPFHPVIDAIAYVMVDAVSWLLYIRVSLTPYAGHRSKAKNLQVKISRKTCKVTGLIFLRRSGRT